MKGIILTALCVVFSIANSYSTCSCEEQNTKDSYKKSDLIFTAKLIDKEIKISEMSAPKIGKKQLYRRVIFTFEVIELIKGKKTSNIITINSKCDNIDFSRGEEYLIYSYYSEYLLTTNFYLNGEKVTPFLATDVCTKTKALALVDKKEIKKLKKYARKRKA